jgi:hypothetical protein
MADQIGLAMTGVFEVLHQIGVQLREVERQAREEDHQEEGHQVELQQFQAAADQIRTAAQFAMAAHLVGTASVQLVGAISAVATASKGAAGAVKTTPTTPTAPSDMKPFEMQGRAIDTLISQQKQTLDSMLKSSMQARTGAFQEQQSKMLTTLKQLQAKQAEILKLTTL